MKIDFLPKAKRFLGPPVDEVALHAAAQAALHAENGDLDRALSHSQGDLATAVLYKYILTSQHAEFIRALDALPVAVHPVRKNLKVLIAPGMFYAEYPDVGADGALVKRIFEVNGFAAEVIRVKPRGSVSENKQIVLQAIEREGDREYWILSLSKGTADVRACLQEIPDPDFPPRLKGWINFSGVYSGSALADLRAKTRLKKMFVRTVCRLAGVNPQLVDEMSTAHAYWRGRPRFLQSMKLIHVLGFPLASHVQPMLSHRFSEMSKLGPTDGMIRLRDAVDYPGHVYPMWGCDHFARTPAISALLYRLCHYIIQSSTHP